MTFFQREPVSAEAIRQTIFWLGNKHGGNALGGAWLELRGPQVTPERRRLLEAVILHLSPDRPPRAASSLPVVPDVTPLGVLAFAAVIGAAMTIVSMLL
jgi:hypothetical protein